MKGDKNIWEVMKCLYPWEWNRCLNKTNNVLVFSFPLKLTCGWCDPSSSRQVLHLQIYGETQLMIILLFASPNRVLLWWSQFSRLYVFLIWRWFFKLMFLCLFGNNSGYFSMDFTLDGFRSFWQFTFGGFLAVILILKNVEMPYL